MKNKQLGYLSVLAMIILTLIMDPSVTSAQSRGTPTPQPQTGTPAPQPQRGTPTAQPQRGQRAAAPAKAPTPLTLRQVIESLVKLRSSSRMEEQVSKAGVDFQATPAVVDILKQFGASPKLISMVPPPKVPPPPPPPPAPKMAGTLTVICEPRDCTVIVGDKHQGTTNENRTTVAGLLAGATTIQILADGYEQITRQVVLEEGKSVEEKFSLKRSDLARQESAKVSLLKTMTSLGGIEGLMALADIEGEGTMRWMTSSGDTEEWKLTFNKRMGKDLSATFRATAGQCTASIQAQTVKQECRGGLRNGGEKIAEQGASLFLSYQLQDVIQTLLGRPLVTSETNQNRLDSMDGKDSYVLVTGNDGLPNDLVYRIGESESPIHVQYSNYLTLGRARYPGRISVGRLNAAPAWVFILTNVRSRVGREK